MHFVAALDRVEGMRCVFGLFEGVVTGAADGYARDDRKPGRNHPAWVDGALKPCRGIRCVQLAHSNSSITAFAALRSTVSNPSLN